MNRGSTDFGPGDVPGRSGFNEAPIHESGKCQPQSGLIRAYPASMRPRFMNRGSRTPMASRGMDATRFNEAPIHESGKSTAQAQDRPATGRFNEAPIHESGK